jgi:hypothetical protein
MSLDDEFTMKAGGWPGGSQHEAAQIVHTREGCR